MMKLTTDDGRVWGLVRIPSKMYEKDYNTTEDYPFENKKEPHDVNGIYEGIKINGKFYAPKDVLEVGPSLEDLREKVRLERNAKEYAMAQATKFYENKGLVSFLDIKTMADNIYTYLTT